MPASHATVYSKEVANCTVNRLATCSRENHNISYSSRSHGAKVGKSAATVPYICVRDFDKAAVRIRLASAKRSLDDKARQTEVRSNWKKDSNEKTVKDVVRDIVVNA